MWSQLSFLALSSLSLAHPQAAAPPAASPFANGQIPRIGLGTARMRGNTSEAVAQAIQNGFRHLDCAYIYGNQKDVGAGIKEGLKRTGLRRQDLWITGKLWSDRHKRAEFGLQESLKELGVEYLDLFLIHWPHDNGNFTPSFDHVETWKSMQKLVGKGTNFIGVSNFGPQQVEDLMALPGQKPLFHEFELHPYVQQEEFVKTNLKHNITVIGYAPLGNTQNLQNMGVSVNREAVPQLLKTDLVKSIASARNCSPAQVVLAWNLMRKVVVIPKASQATHQKENIMAEKACPLIKEDIARFEKEILMDGRIRFYAQACGYGLEEGCAMAKKHTISVQ